MFLFGGGTDVGGAGSVTAGVAATAGATSAAGIEGVDCFLFFALRRAWFLRLFSALFRREDTPREVCTEASRRETVTSGLTMTYEEDVATSSGSAASY